MQFNDNVDQVLVEDVQVSLSVLLPPIIIAENLNS